MRRPRSLLAVWAIACAPEHGSLELRVVDAATGRTTPARLELLDADGAPHVPDDALLLTYECEVAPLPAWAAGFQRRRTLENPDTWTVPFYLTRPATAELPVGR